MRNIRIADRKDWVFSHPEPPPPPSRWSKHRDILATLPIILLIPALILPFVMTAAATPSLEMTPDAPTPGQRIVIVGTGFDSRETGLLVWPDGTELAAYRTSANGRFSVKVRLPPTLERGVL